MDQLKNIIKKITTFHTNSKQDVLIFSAPRSGSTWLLEIIAANSSGKSISEPLDLRKAQVSSYLGTTDWTYFLQKENLIFILDYLKKISNGELSFKNPPIFTKYYKPIVDHSIIKILHGGEMMAKELLSGLNAKGIFLIRHPIPVSLSRKQLPRLNSFLKTEMKNLTLEQQKFIEGIVSKNDFFELCILDWCFQNIQGIGSENIYDLKITYEELVLKPEKVINDLINISVLDKIRNINESLKTPSRNSFKSNQERLELLESNDRDEIKLIGSWMDKVDDNQLKSAQKILDAFNIKLYNVNSPYPVQGQMK